MADWERGLWTLETMARVHIAYELEVMCALAGAEKASGKGHEMLDTMYLEAMLVHVRNLDEFLRTKRWKVDKDQVCADHYFEGPWSPIVDAIDKEMLGRMSTSLVHISRKRLVAGGWTSRDGTRAPFAEDILRGFERFVDELRDDHPDRARWFESGLAVAQKTLRASLSGGIVFARVARDAGRGISVSTTSTVMHSSSITGGTLSPIRAPEVLPPGGPS
jgi:hypothetical protein